MSVLQRKAGIAPSCQWLSNGRGKKVSFMPLDDAIEDIDLHKVKLLKVDTEGFDARVLRGSQNVLKIGRPVVLFEYNRENLTPLGEDGLSSFVRPQGSWLSIGSILG